MTTTATELFLIDGSSFLFRAYYQSINQDPRYNVRAADGLPTGAVRLFMSKMRQLLEKGAAGVMPTHVMVAFDVSRAGWRRDMYPAYKSSREAPPDDLKPQMPYMRHAIRALGMQVVELERFEADDIIATYARLGVEAGGNVTLISADKDIMQLVRDGVRFYDSQSGKPGKPGYRPERNYDVEGVREAWEGLLPSQIVEAQALIGDDVDDIPGIKGIGLKTAVELIAEFGTVEEMLSRTAEIKQPKRRQAIEEGAETIRTSRALAALRDDVPVPLTIEQLALGPFDYRRAAAFAKAMDFPVIFSSLCKAGKLDANLVEADPEFAAVRAPSSGEEDLPSIDNRSYRLVEDARRLDEWLTSARTTGRIAVCLLREAGDIVGAGIATGPGMATYIPVGHEEKGTLFGGRFEGQVDRKDLARFLDAVRAEDGIVCVGYDIKSDWGGSGFSLFGERTADVMLLSYALDNGRARHELEALSIRMIGHHPTTLDSILGTGKSRVGASYLKPETLLQHMAEKAEIVVRLHPIFSRRLETDAAAAKVYTELELPLAPVIAGMESRGIAVNHRILGALSEEFAERMAKQERRAWQHAGVQFPLASPKQVGDVLFDHLGLPGAKKTPTGQWQTSAGVLDDLAAAGHEVAAAILDWRQVSKLKSTYADALRQHSRNGIVHTTFGLAATPTARLVSLEPNLQNIPVRTEDGRRIRTAFEAPAGRKIVSADYSQIELRILAHVADVEELRQAFADGVDIHAMTASEMFGIPIEGMPPEIRRGAKAINFGIVYGISAFGLSRQLGISVQDAGDYIARYFRRFPGIRDYIEKTKEDLARDGYVETMFGRKIHFPHYSSAKGPEKANIERAAINAPIQGSAADVIRRAMIRMPWALDGIDANMLLQVHDELLFDVADESLETAIPVIVETMEGACAPDVNVSVRLGVEANAGANWDEAH